MRIDLVITELDTGGAERCCAELAQFLSSRNHRVRILALGPRPKPPKQAIADWLDEQGVPVEYLGGTTWRQLPSVAWRLRSAFQRDKPDVVQSFLWHANVLAASVLPYRSVPLIGGVRVAEPKASRHPLSRLASKRMSQIVCVSESIRDWCIRVEGVPASKLVVIPNGIRTSTQVAVALDPNSHQVPDNAKVLLFVGRLNEQKGIDVLLKNVASLLNRLPEYHLVLIGDGPLRRQCDELAAGTRGDEERGEDIVKGRLHVLGRRDDVASWMARAQLFVLPTRYEGMPNVILEAMSAKLPVATLLVEGVAELLGDSQDDQSVAAEDWLGFFELVLKLARNDALREQLGDRNKHRVEHHFQLDAQLIRYEDLYGKFLGTVQR